MRILHKVFSELKYIILNNFVCYLPFWPLRWLIYTLFGMKIGKGSKILMNVKVYAPENIVIGERVWVNEKAYLDGRGGINIGSDVTIATFSKLITGSHNIDDDFFSYMEAPILIEDHCAVFSDSLILGGATLRQGVIISAKSLVRRGVYQAYGIYAGNPAKYIRDRKSKCIYNQAGCVVFR